MPEREAPAGRVLLAFAAIYVLWGSTYLGIRFAVETLPPFLMAGTRHLTAGILLYVWNRFRGEPRPRLSDWGVAAAIGALMLLGGNGLVSWAEQRVPSGLAALIVASVPLWITVLEAAQKRRAPRGAVIAGLLLGIASLAWLLVPGRFGGNGHVDPLGAGALLLAALCWAVGSLYSRVAKLSVSTFVAIAMEMIAGGLILWSAGFLVGEGARLHLGAVSARSLLALGYLIVFGSLAGFSAYMWLLRVTTPARVSTYAYVNPVVAVLVGWAVAGEALTLRTAIATLGIVGAVAIIIRFGGKERQEKIVRELESEEPARLRAGRAS
ncbi:MAG TPA: EamA family transporter [Thermoanaerobaculia bacterium]|nr:EamA family transporter [Thermoanaerobaculia bacterium]